MDNLSDFLKEQRQVLKKLLAEDMELALKQFTNLLDPDSEKYDAMILLLERYNRTNRGFLGKIISFQDATIEFSTIASSILNYIKRLEINDLAKE